MTTLNVIDANTGQTVEIDLNNPTGTLYVLDENTGEFVLLDLASPAGTLSVIDANTGEFVTIDYSNPTAIFNVIDPNTGLFVEIDLSNLGGSLYCLDENLGEFVLVNLSDVSVINTRRFTGVLGSFDPLTLSPLWWYDFSDISTLFQDNPRTTPITADGQIVRGVADKSGNGWHLVGTTTYKTNIHNGKSAVLYDGSTDNLNTAPIAHGIGTGDFYLVAVDKPIDVTNGYRTIWSNGTYTPAFYHSDDGKVFAYFFGAKNFVPGTCSVATHIIEIYRESGDVTLLVDGVNQGTVTLAENIGTGISILGWDNYPSGDRLNGYQMEVFLFNTLPSVSNREALRSHLMSKWGF